MENLNQLSEFIEIITENCDSGLAEAIQIGFNSCFKDELALTEGRLSQTLGMLGLMATTVFAGGKKSNDFIKNNTPEKVATIIVDAMNNGTTTTDEAMNEIKKIKAINPQFAAKTFTLVKSKLGITNKTSPKQSPSVTYDFDMNKKLIQTKNGMADQYVVTASNNQSLKYAVEKLVKDVMGDSAMSSDKIDEIMAGIKPNSKNVSFILPVK